MEKSLTEKFVGYIPSFISGILLVLAFPVFDIYPLAWIAFVPFLLSLWKKNSKESFIAGFIFGFIYFFGTLYWLYHSIYIYGSISFFISILIVLVFCCYLGLYPAVFSWLFSFVIKKTKLPALLIAPSLWVALEFLRSYALTGFPWSSIGYSQYKFLTIIQFSDITGVYGISFLVLAVNGAIVDFLLFRKRVNEMPLFPVFYTAVGSAFLLLLLIFAFGYGTWRTGQNRTGKFITASIIQGNIEQDKKWEPAFQQEVMDIYTRLSLEGSKSLPDLIVWPETSLPFMFENNSENTKKLTQFQKELGSYLLFGSVSIKKKISNKTYLANSAFLLDRTGKITYKYDKIHLVPFGEYVPFRNILFFIDKLVEGVGDFVSGEQYLKAETEFGSFGTLICYEIVFPGLVRKFYTKGGDLMVSITNDAWFGKTPGPYQHFSMGVFRAIENRKPLIRSANSGVSCFVDSNGKILSQSSLFQRQILTNKIKTDNTLTFYTKYGDIFSFLCIVLSVILIINTKLRR